MAANQQRKTRTYFNKFLGEQLKMVQNARENQDSLKYCAFCAQEDRISPGEAYWHRLHQSSIVQVCPKHRCYLSRAAGKRHFSVRLTLAEEAIPITEPIKMANPDEPYDALLLWMARQVEWLLGHPDAKIDTTNLSAAYTQGFHSNGLLTSGGNPDLTRIREQFRKVIGKHIEHGEHFNSVYHANSDRSLNRAIHFLEGHPGLHLLLLYFLGTDVESLPTMSKYCHFELGPWPCLNLVCEHHEKDVIHEYSFRTDTHGAQVATFRCLCGYIYSRQAPDFEGESRLCPHRVLQTGNLWNREFQRLWSDSSLRIPEIARKLACSIAHIRKMISILDVPSRKPRRKRRQLLVGMSPFDEKRAALRKIIQTFIMNNPHGSRTEFYKYAPAEMNWLWKNDRDWLESFLPKSNKWEGKVDWQERDRGYAKSVKSVKKDLIASQRSTVFPITIERLKIALRFQPKNTQRSYFPKTNKALQAAAETPEQYRVRKLLWAIENSNSELPPTFGALLVKVNFRLEMRSRPTVAEAIQAAKGLYEKRRNSCVAAGEEAAA